MTRAGKYVFVANTGSRSIRRVIGTGNHVFVDGLVAAQIPTGAPADIDADSGILGVIDHGALGKGNVKLGRKIHRPQIIERAPQAGLGPLAPMVFAIARRKPPSITLNSRG